jgi:hypothetical protein
MPRGRQLFASSENFRGRALMPYGSIAQRHSEEGSGIHSSASFQQCEKKVWTETDAGMADHPNLITSQNCASRQRRSYRGKMAIHADIPVVLDQHLQSARTAMLNAQELARGDGANRRPLGRRQINAVVEATSLGAIGKNARPESRRNTGARRHHNGTGGHRRRRGSQLSGS